MSTAKDESGRNSSLFRRAQHVSRRREDLAEKYLDVAGVMFVVIDADQRVSLINKKGCEVLGYSEDQILGRNWFDSFIPQRDRDRVKAVFEKLMAGEVEPVEYYENTVLTRSGEERIISWHNTVVKDDQQEVVSTLGSGEDITERKRAEEKLDRAVAELERSNMELEQFASVVSHDLKDPLLAVAADLKLLQRRAGGQLNAQAEKLVASALDGTQRMETLIHELFAYARLGAKKKPFRVADCSRILARSLANLKATIESCEAEVTYDPLPRVVVDATLLVQLFQNLINNAIKFRGEEPPRIHVSAEYNGMDWVFSVRDNGIGIHPKNAERIFEIFQRLHPRKRYPGTGMGLAICKKIVEYHGGRIWVESQLESGSSFYFALPDRAGPYRSS